MVYNWDRSRAEEARVLAATAAPKGSIYLKVLQKVYTLTIVVLYQMTHIYKQYNKQFVVT